MTTADWLRAKIGPAPYPAAPDGKHLQPGVLRFFTQYLRPDMRVLHAYSGDGAPTLSMSEHVLTGEVVGVDPDMDNVRAARRRSVAPDGAEITFERGALGRLPFGPEEFDAVLLGGSLSSVDSPERALEEVQGVLVPGGLLGVRHTVASSRVFSGKSRLLERSLDRQETILRDLGGDPDVGLRQPNLLRSHGFVNVRVTSSTEQQTEDELLAALSREGFVPADDGEGVDDSGPVISFVTVIESVCWKPA
ncbi:MAG: class I SAM-dependent methyltransferase [Chloroflexi bacterium]|nr:class I SAM-dependent methyltransferase [Chloroflexota bacterium]